MFGMNLDMIVGPGESACNTLPDHFTTVPVGGETIMPQHPIPAPTIKQDAVRQCHVCKALKPLPEFGFDSRRGRYASRCRPCNSEYMKRYYANNKTAWDDSRKRRQTEINATKRQRYRDDPEYRRLICEKVTEYRRLYPERKRATALRSNYGINPEEYDAILSAQGGGCGICGSHTTGGKRPVRLNVDHCHASGAVRGILCAKCNKAIGLFDDDPDRLVKAADYLRRTDNASR